MTSVVYILNERVMGAPGCVRVRVYARVRAACVRASVCVVFFKRKAY